MAVLATGVDEECPVCLDSLVNPVITHCAHVFCRPCIENVIKTTDHQRSRCPLCRGDIKNNQLVEVPNEVEDGGPADGEKWQSSSKVRNKLTGGQEALLLNWPDWTRLMGGQTGHHDTQMYDQVEYIRIFLCPGFFQGRYSSSYAHRVTRPTTPNFDFATPSALLEEYPISAFSCQRFYKFVKTSQPASSV